MYYFRRNQDGDWKEFKLSAEEVAKVQTLTVSECIKIYAKIDDVSKKLGVTLTPERVQGIFDKVAPTYTELAQDIIADQQSKKKTAAPAA